MWMKMSTEHWWNGTDRIKLKYWEKNLSSASLFTTNLTRTGVGLKLGLCGQHGDKPPQPRIHSDLES
jgi:hypothetical protein